MIKNLQGILEEFSENYPIWDEIDDYEQLDFDTEWCNAIGQYELLKKELISGELVQQLEEITRRIIEIKPKLLELDLIVPKGI
jgi:hypothetical protein